MKRDLPWRRTRDPYGVWIAEVMLQQTQVATVIPYYQRFLGTLPTVRQLAEAPLDDVLRLWAGLGYYSRARNLHAAAKAIVGRHGGRFPRSFDEVLALPGIGRYTASAILSIALGQRHAAIDTNAARVLARVFLVRGDARSGRARQRIERLGAEAVPAERPGDHNQALMELGSVMCLPRDPRCGECPLVEVCEVRRRGLQAKVPAPRERIVTRAERAVVGIVRRNGKVLIAQRPTDAVWGGLWVFPGTDLMDGTEARRALTDRLREAFGLKVVVGGAAANVTYGIMNRRVQLSVHACAVQSGRTRARARSATRWVRPAELGGFAMPAPHRRVARIVQTGGAECEAPGPGPDGPAGHSAPPLGEEAKEARSA